MAEEGGLIALTFILLAALFVLLYCLLRQTGASKQCIRRICASLLGGASSYSSHAQMASGGLYTEDEDEYSQYMDESVASGGRSGKGLFWKHSSDEERSILAGRRGPGTKDYANSGGFQSLSGNNYHKFGLDSGNIYHSDYLSYEKEQMATTTTANPAKMPPPPVTNGISVAPKPSHGVESVGSIPSQGKMKNVDPISSDYTYNIQQAPRKDIPISSTQIPTSKMDHVSDSPNSRRRPPSRGQQKSTEAMARQLQTQHSIGGNSRPATPDFRYTVLADDEEDPERKSHAVASSNTTAGTGRTANGTSLATNSNTFRSISVDAGDRGQLSADMSADNARRHSLSMSPTVSPSVSIDNPSPSGSVSDLDPESMLVLDEQQSGMCSRRTSISSVDSNLECLAESGKPNLMRALSSDSLDSTCSIAELSNNEQDIGQLETRLFYDSNTQYLHVWILQAYDIKPIPCSNNGGLVEYWVVVFLLPHQKPLYRTQLQPYAPVLQFHEQFRQRVRDQDLRKVALLCQMYCRMRPPNETVGAALAAASATPPLIPTSSSSSAFTTPSKKGGIAGNELVGQAKVRLKDVELSVANTLWLSLLPRFDNSSGDKHLGELLFSLSYLPTAERLTVVVAKARNIRTFDSIMPEKIMVRVYLVYGAKISKKKTSIKNTVEGSAIFNESIIFSLGQNLVQKVYLRLSVVEPSSMKSSGDQRTIGHVTVGSRRTSKEFGHWQKMIEQPRKPVSMWHHLSPKSQKLA